MRPGAPFISRKLGYAFTHSKGDPPPSFTQSSSGCKICTLAAACRVAVAADLESLAAQQQQRIWALQTQQGISSIISGQSSHMSLAPHATGRAVRINDHSDATALNAQALEGCVGTSESSTSTIDSSDGAVGQKQVGHPDRPSQLSPCAAW